MKAYSDAPVKSFKVRRSSMQVEITKKILVALFFITAATLVKLPIKFIKTRAVIFLRFNL